jgi:hypothetical protein
MDDGMGTIIQLTARARSAPQENPPEGFGACEIVIFPGVRIERQTSASGQDFVPRSVIDDGTDRGRPRKSS